MNDNSIRKILIEYLCASCDKIRIYQEKMIGSAVCDVMAVTDCLTGYEIKSDLDNYDRLERQVSAYSQFFDKNYLVVSARHRVSASDKVPPEWGIICILGESISMERPARWNRSVSLRMQLSILWKLELKNLLIKNGMPLYAQKPKSFIADRILEHVAPDLLGQQIAEELLCRDASVFQTQNLSEDEKQYTPIMELLDSASEQDLGELTLDKWIGMYQEVKALQHRKDVLFSHPVKQRIQHTIPYTEIEVSLGASWIPPSIITDFIHDVLKNTVAFAEYEPVTGNWNVANKFWGKNESCVITYGLERYNALYILEATLNLREIKLYDGTRYSEPDTLAALEKQKHLVSAFKEWIWQDENRIWEVEDAYNRMFDGLTKLQYDGSRLAFPDMAEDMQLYPFQKDAVERIVQEQNTLLALDVGSGKTLIMIAAAMTMRQRGISRRNLFVVPNHIVGQWEKQFTLMYPKARILTVEPKTFAPVMRQKVLTQMRTGDYDGIIIAYSCFEMIPLSQKCVTDAMERELEQIHSVIRDIKTTGWKQSALERERQYIRKLTENLLASMDAPAPGITFDMLEINSIFLDEAHNYKNLPLRTTMRDLTGINTKGSNKCLEMLQKIRCVQEQNGGRGAILATATPLCNSISDVYAMQMYLQYEALKERRLHRFDNWVKTFAQPEQFCEIDVDTSRFRMIRRFARFFNLPELSLLFSQIAVFHAVEQREGLPVFDGYEDVLIKRNRALSGYMQELCRRTELIRSGIIDRAADNMLKVSTDGRKAALDLTLVGKEQPYDATSKVRRCADTVLQIYREYPGTSQLVFCDYSTPKGEKFNVYEKLRELLTEAGIPQKEIAFVHSYQTEQRKLKLYSQVNAGVVRVLIGSTFKLGIGANVQTKLKAVHHLDVPWRPADMIQREGRILRRGNTNDSIRIFRYIATGSFDAYSWQILETKQRFISQFLTGTAYQRTAADLESNVLTYGEVKALALSSPAMKALAEKENELRHLTILSQKHDSDKSLFHQELGRLNGEIRSKAEKLGDAKTHAEYFRSVSALSFSALYQQYKDKLTPSVLSGEVPLSPSLSFFDFELVIPDVQPEKHPIVLLKHAEFTYPIEMGNSQSGNLQRVLNFLKRFDRTAQTLEQELAELQNKKAVAEAALTAEDPYAAQIIACEAELQRLREQI